MLKSLFDDQRRYLDHFFEEFDYSQAETVFEKLRTCKGAIILSGLGKSGHIAEKIAATLLSTGTKAFFLHPANALHGDIGLVSSSDIFLVLSKSGSSQELIDLIPYIKKKGAQTIAVVSVANSRLAQLCDDSVFLPVQREICPYDLAPTTSSAAQLIFGDCLAVALMHEKQFSLADFAQNHPSGSLGRKITHKVADLMLKGKDLPTCKPQDLLLDVIHELSAKRCGCLLVVSEEGKLLGIFTDGDLRRAIHAKGPEGLRSQVQELMTGSPKSVCSQELALEAVKKMEEDPSRPITVLPVLEQGQLIGLIRMHDIIQKEFS